MTAKNTVSPVPEATGTGLGQARAWRLLRAIAVVGFLMTLLLTLLLGHEKTSYARFSADLSHGQIHEVSVNGGLPQGAIGSAILTIIWRDGWVAHETTVTQYSSWGEVQRETSSREPLFVGDLDQHLKNLDPQLRIHHGMEVATTGSIRNWTVPSFVAISVAVLVLLTLGLLCGGPEPRLATRWAWFWLIFSPACLIAALAYLLVDPGRDPDDAQRRRTRRLTGGWAFLLVIFVLGGLGFSKT